MPSQLWKKPASLIIPRLWERIGQCDYGTITLYRKFPTLRRPRIFQELGRVRRDCAININARAEPPLRHIYGT